MFIKKNDNVKIIKGVHKGGSGRIIKIFKDSDKAIVEGVNLRKHSQRPSQKDPKGGIVEKESPLTISNLMLICPKCNEPSRTGVKILEDKKKVRICKKCSEVVE